MEIARGMTASPSKSPPSGVAPDGGSLGRKQHRGRSRCVSPGQNAHGDLAISYTGGCRRQSDDAGGSACGTHRCVGVLGEATHNAQSAAADVEFPGLNWLGGRLSLLGNGSKAGHAAFARLEA